MTVSTIGDLLNWIATLFADSVVNVRPSLAWFIAPHLPIYQEIGLKLIHHSLWLVIGQASYFRLTQAVWCQLMELPNGFSKLSYSWFLFLFIPQISSGIASITHHEIQFSAVTATIAIAVRLPCSTAIEVQLSIHGLRWVSCLKLQLKFDWSVRIEVAQRHFLDYVNYLPIWIYFQNFAILLALYRAL